MSHRQAEPPEDAWPDSARFGHAVAKFRATWWLTVGDLFWRVGLTGMAGSLYQRAVRAERDADGITKQVRDFYDSRGQA